MNEMNYKSKAPNFKNDHKIQTTDLLTNNLNSSSISIVFSLVSVLCLLASGCESGYKNLTVLSDV